MAGKINGLKKFPFYNMRKNNDKTSVFNDFNKAYYTTGGYDDYLRRFKREGQDYALKLLGVVEPDSNWRFLDVGCGMGGLVLALRELGFEAWGTEVSPFCLKFSPVKKWMQFGNICNLPFPSNSFEVVTCIDVFCYLNREEIMKAIEELVRAAKHYLYVESICKDSPNNNQKLNPDSLRKDEDLLKANEIKTVFERNNTLFLEPLYRKEELEDFSGVFVK